MQRLDDQYWDHSFLVFEGDQNAVDALRAVQPSRFFAMPYNPTAENMARYLLDEAAPGFMQGSGGQVVRVRIWETEDSYAEAALPGLALADHADHAEALVGEEV